MKPKKDIFTLFRQSRHKLDEPPSRQAWQKLERRLDGHRNRGSFQLYRSLAMVAAVVALVAVVFGISILLEQFEPKADAGPVAMEELSYSETEDDGFRTVVEFQKKYKSRFARPVSIDEGSPEKRLVSIRLLKSDQSIAEAETLTAKKEAARGKVNVSPAKAHPTKPKSKAAVSSSGEDTENRGFAEAENKKKPTFSSPKNELRKGTGFLVPEVAVFQWLIGQWKETLASGESYEEWVVKNEFTIEGKAYLMVDGKKTFPESMKIQKIGGDVFYILSLDASEKPLRFKLKTNSAKGAVFENEKVATSSQIILKTDGTKTEFTTIYQSQPGRELPPLQLNYLRQRNQLLENNQKATRTLFRLTAN